MRPKKPTSKRHIGIGISIPGGKMTRIKRRAKARRFVSVSSYVRSLIDADLERSAEETKNIETRENPHA